MIITEFKLVFEGLGLSPSSSTDSYELDASRLQR
jgi:hypothetical protein